MFSDFLETLNSLRLRTARFRRVALHVHSPDSHDWGKNAPDKSRNDKERFAEEAGLDLFLDELRPHFDCVGITDHMKCTFGTNLSARTVGDDELLVLPGMEVNLRLSPPFGFARIHLLSILKEGSTPYDFACLFRELQGVSADDNLRTGHEEVVDVDLAEWVRRVHGEDGICIAAHVDNSQGIRHHFRQVAKETMELFSAADGSATAHATEVSENLKQYLLNSGLDAIEIHKSEDAKHYRWASEVDGTPKSIATILTSDPHTIEQFERPERTTHIKMTRPGLKGLKEAFRFSDTRIRFPGDVSSPPSPRILGIRVVGGEESFFSDISVAVAENLNCLIGVRGSGKSTLVESLRYVFGYNRSLKELDKLQDSIQDLQNRNLVDSKIQVAYRTKSGDDRILEATFDAKSNYATKVYTSEGDQLAVSDVESCGDYPLRLFGWSEIEILGRDPAKQRDLLDRLIPELSPVLSKRKELRNGLEANRGEVIKCIQEVKSALGQEDGQIKRFKEYQKDFQTLNTDEVKELFAALDLAQGKKRILMQLQSNSKQLIGKLTDLATPEPPGNAAQSGEEVLPATSSINTAVSLQREITNILEAGGDDLRNWWHEEELERLSVTSAEADVQRAIQAATERIRSFEALVAEHMAQADSEIEAIQKGLRDEFKGNDSMQRIVDLRGNAAKRLRDVSVLRETYLQKWRGLEEILSDRLMITDQLTSTQNEIAGIRSRHNDTVEETLNQFLTDEMKVSIDFKAGGDRTEFRKSLKAIFGARSKQVKRIRQIGECHCTPVEFSRMCLENSFGNLVGKKSDLEGVVVEFVSEDAKSSCEKMSPYDYDEYADVNILANDGLTLETIIDLQETEWDDHETILLNGGPVNEKSPGQRSSAMLPLIALAESVPLVIDQPEDNLDKRLIGTVLTNVLSVLKDKRQIIVCTHDPNILVGGDAEQVVVLEAESDRRGKVALHGSIDNEDIIGTVVNLLEGGAEAFETRRKRYGISDSPAD